MSLKLVEPTTHCTMQKKNNHQSKSSEVEIFISHFNVQKVFMLTEDAIMRLKPPSPSAEHISQALKKQ